MQIKLLTSAMLLMACSVGCKGNDKANASEKETSDVPADLSGAVEEAKARLDDGKALTAKQYEALMLKLTTCKVTDDGIEHKCEAYKELRKASNLKTTAKDWGGAMSGLGKKHLGHKHPAVRIKAAQLMSSFFGSNKKTQNTILDAIAKEKEPPVVVAMMDVVASSASKNAKVGEMLLDMLDHKAPIVRKKAVYGLSSSWAKDVDGRIAKLITKMEDDPDPKTQQAACEYAGKTGDEKLIPVYKKLTKKSVDKDLRASCMKGLVETWFSYPFYGTYSEAGYKLTIDRLNKTPRSEAFPPWGIMSSFEYLENEKSDGLKKWRQKATWYDKKELIAALVSIVKDEEANWMGRSGAVRSLAKLMKKKKFKKLADECEGKCNSHVAKALKDAVAKL